MKQHAIGGLALVALGLVAAFAQDDPDAGPQAEAGEPTRQELQHPIAVAGPVPCSHEGEAHPVADAVIVLSCHNAGPNDCTRFDLLLFRDGCYSLQGTALFSSFSKDATVPSRLVELILQDAQTYGLDAFDGDLRLSEWGCEQWLTVRDGDLRKSFVFDRVALSQQYMQAAERGAESAHQLTVVDLIAKRLDSLLIE
jgi:hypothetical protein